MFASGVKDSNTHQHFLMDTYSVRRELSVHALVDSQRSLNSTMVVVAAQDQLS
jgi:hypothetical protein